MLLTVAKVIFDLFVSPEDQLARQRRVRHEERREVAAGRVRKLLGLTGSLLADRVAAAWEARNAEKLGATAQALGDLAEKAYHEIEMASDPLEVLIGVLMVEAWEIAEAAPSLESISTRDWEKHAAAGHFALLMEYIERIQGRLHEILDNHAQSPNRRQRITQNSADKQDGV